MPWVSEKTPHPYVTTPPDRYVVECLHMPVSDAGIAWLDAERVRLIQARDEVIALKKEFGREHGKFLKEQERDLMKLYRAVIYVMQQVMCDPPGDARKATAAEEYAALIDYYFGCAGLYGGNNT